MTPTALAEDSDEALVARIRAGEPACFETLMRRHNATLYRIARSVVRDEAEAEDVMQEAYVNAFTHLDGFSFLHPFGTWLRTIAFNEALRRVRRARHAPIAEADLDTLDTPSSEPTPEAAAGNTQLKAALEQAIDALPDGYREVFMLRSVAGCSLTETAEVLGIEEGTVKTRLFRARGRLRQTLAEWIPQTFEFPATRCDRVVAAVWKRLERSEQ